MRIANLPYQYVPNPARGTPVFNGSMYIGQPDLDPEIPLNQISVSIQQENGTIVPVSQPIQIGPGGVPIYNGSPAIILIDESVFSIKVEDNLGAQKFYQGRASSIELSVLYTSTKLVVDTVKGATNSLESLTGMANGTSAQTLGYNEVGDGGGRDYYYDENSAATVDGGSVINASGGIGRWLTSFPDKVPAICFGVRAANTAAENTAIIQTALAYAVGKPVVIPPGAAFNLSDLVFDTNNGANGYYAMEYRANDDDTSPGHPFSNDTNEIVIFQQNFNSSGYNNEVIYTTGYSTAVTVNTRRDLDSSHVGAGQVNQYGRCSFGWSQDDLSRMQLKYTDSAGDTSSPGLDDGWTAQFLEPRQLLTGLGSSDFSALAINSMVRGQTSGARGWVKSFTTSTITVMILSGRFVAGEKLIREPNVETTVGTLSSVGSIAYTSRSNRMGLSSKNGGNFFANLQGNDAPYPMNVGGAIAIQNLRNSIGTYTDSFLIIADDLLSPTKQVLISLESSTGDMTIKLGAAATLVARLSTSLLTLPVSLRSTGGGLTPKAYTSAQLNDKTNAVNTTNKFDGTMVYNTSVDKPVWAAGANDTDVWKDASAVTVNTPV